ncbi:MAG: CoA-binding protein [Terriglobales bacterium]
MKLPADVVAAVRAAKVIAVVGLSSHPVRPSFGVARYLQGQGYRILPVNPNETTVLGEAAYADLDRAAAAAPVDIVDVFRRSEYVPEVAAAAIRIGAKMLWLQEGVSHPEAEAQARAAGLLVVADHCLLKEHARLRGGGN